MTEEEKEAIDRLNRIITTKFNNDYSIDNLDKEAIETVLNMLKAKDIQIDLMAKCIDTELSSSRLAIILNKNVKPLEIYKNDIKQYFEKKAKQEKL